jgi:hypothetical protein
MTATTEYRHRPPQPGVAATGYGRRSAELLTAICRELHELAEKEEQLAAAAAAMQEPSWMDSATVAGHRAAARALRADADRLEREARHVRAAS